LFVGEYFVLCIRNFVFFLAKDYVPLCKNKFVLNWRDVEPYTSEWLSLE